MTTLEEKNMNSQQSNQHQVHPLQYFHAVRTTCLYNSSQIRKQQHSCEDNLTKNMSKAKTDTQRGLQI